MKINSFRFGDIVISGNHHQDCKIMPDGTVRRWDYYEHHTVTLKDINGMMDKVEFFVIGTGASGLVRVEQEVVDALNEKGLKLYIRTTPEAVAKINELAQAGRAFAAILHSTC